MIALGGGVSCFPAPLHEQRSWWPEFVEVGSGVVSVNKPAGVSSPLSVLPVMFCRFGCHGGRGLAVLLGGGVLGEREGDGGPGGCRWPVGVGSAGFLHGRPDPKRDELGAWRWPMQIHWPDPSRRRWWFLRLTTPLGKGFILLQVAGLKTMFFTSAVRCRVDFGRLQVVWKKEVSWSSVFCFPLVFALVFVLYL